KKLPVKPVFLTAADELADIRLQGRPRADIEADLISRGYTSVPANSGGKVWTKSMPDGKTASVRIDPAMNRQPPLGYADEVVHAHKEIVPTANVRAGNYGPPGTSGSVSLDEAGNVISSPNSNAGRRAAHIPIR
ncbi:hypothetical protein J2I47_26310, partial [Fibrella sp. HMF5335]